MAGTIKIAIDHTKVGSTLSNFPLMVHLSDSAGINLANLSAIFNELNYSKRKKFMVTDYTGLQLFVEISYWDDAQKQAFLWVKVPSISNINDTVLYLDYDSTWADNTTYVGDVNSTPGEQVWSDFSFVWHGVESGNGTVNEYKDSTFGHNHGRGGSGTVSKVPSRQIDEKGLPYPYFDGNQHIEFNDSPVFSIPTPGNFYMSFMARMPDSNFPNPYTYFIGKVRGAGLPGHMEYFWQYAANIRGGARPGCWNWYIGDEAHDLQCTGNINYPKQFDILNDRWYHISGMCSSSGPSDGHPIAYLNGIHSGQESTFQDYDITYSHGNAPFCVGNYIPYAIVAPWIGGLCEIKISHTAHSVAWDKADSYSCKDNLINYSEEASSGGFPAGIQKTARFQIVVKPSDISCQIELWLGPNDTTKIATSGKINFVSTGINQDINLPITLPGAGLYKVYVDIYAGGMLVAGYVDNNPVLVV